MSAGTTTMAANTQHCSFVLLAEFDIDSGAQLTYQFPQPLGTDELLLANLMLPDGAEKQLEDWTIFFLNQTPFSTIAPVLALEAPELNSHGQRNRPELLYVLNLVRTKHDTTVRRGAVVKAMAICTRHPFIQIFKPVLLMALDDYFSDPSQDCLARLFDAINSMDLSAAPTLSRHEKIVMRSSERKDIFAEKFVRGKGEPASAAWSAAGPARATKHRPTNSDSSFEEGILMRQGAAENASVPTHQHSPTDSSFSLGGSAVWVGDESGIQDNVGVPAHNGSALSLGGSTAVSGSTRGRRSTDASSVSSHGTHPYNHGPPLPVNLSIDQQSRVGTVKDTHFFQTTIAYKGHQLPIKMPLSTFPEEVGDYSLIQLVQTFSTPMVTISGPLHPHLHTNGNLTHPIILLFNGLITGKRIIFLGHSRPAGQLANYVLSACALGSGCGAVLRGFIERAFPYATLQSKDDWASIPGYIAGVTNPIFETSVGWDLLFDVGTARVVVHKDIHSSCPPTVPLLHSRPPLILRTGTLKAESSITSEDDLSRPSAKDTKDQPQKSEFVAKADNPDNLFIEDINSAISYHFGETLVRMRFTEYVMRFVRLASRYEEDTLGSTMLGFPSIPFADGPAGRAQLGSGIVFIDEAAGARELSANASRIEGWRRTNSYQYGLADFQTAHATNTIQGFDLHHQLFRLRHAKNMSDSEVELMMRTLAQNVQSYEQVVELLAYLTPHGGGLLPLSFGLLHQSEIVRDTTVDIFNELRGYPVGVLFLQALNHFQRYAYVRQAHAREAQVLKERQMYNSRPPAFTSRTPSNRSESSLGGH